LGIGSINIAEDVGVSADEFFTGVLRCVLEGEGAAFGRKVGVENDLEEKVPEFFAQVGVIRVADGVDRLTGLLEEAGAE
jgi:hypothetical protein